MSLVERLAEKWENSEGERWAKDEARWWLNAIADELDAGYGFDAIRLEFEPTYFPGGPAAEWLRSQAAAEEKS